MSIGGRATVGCYQSGYAERLCASHLNTDLPHIIYSETDSSMSDWHWKGRYGIQGLLVGPADM